MPCWGIFAWAVLSRCCPQPNANLQGDSLRTPGAPFLPRHHLTPKEKEILELVAQGWTARESADQMGISVRTVEHHVNNLRFKLNAENTAHLITRAFSMGVLVIAGGVARVTD